MREDASTSHAFRTSAKRPKAESQNGPKTKDPKTKDQGPKDPKAKDQRSSIKGLTRRPKTEIIEVGAPKPPRSIKEHCRRS